MAHNDIATSSGMLRIEPVSQHAFRIRLSSDGVFSEGGLTRYGIVKSIFADVKHAYVKDGGANTVSTGSSSVIANDDGSFVFSAGGKELLRTVAALRSGEDGFDAAFAIDDTEKIYGLGDVTRERVEKRGFRTAMWVRNVASYVPIPYVMSTRGWAIFVNTTWRHFFDVGYKVKNSMRFWSKHGDLDFFIIAGSSLTELIDRYTDIAGKPHMLPLWAYGLTFVSNQQANAREMIDDCLNLRRTGIPCDVIGLEPGWMSKNYDYSIDKDWHPERFAIPSWVRKPGDVSGGNDHTFMGAAKRLGFKVSLWLCSDYDLSFEEERRATGNKTIGAEQKPEARSDDDFEQDQHFGHGPTKMDKLTKPDVPWFDHLKKFVSDGASAFKMDGALQVNEHPDRSWGNGMNDEEMHNLYPTILNKQMHIGFREATNRRPMIYTSGGYTGVQQYSATWAGDTGGGIKPLVSMINHGMSGHVNTSCDMDVFTPEGIHFGFFQPWSQVCSWAYWRHPWLLGNTLLPIFVFYAKLRYRLLPYIYSAAHTAARTGLPILRGMPLMFPDDAASDGLIHQYMFGEFMLTAAFTKNIHLPAGNWIDLWTGKKYSGPVDLELTPPKGRGGPLFVKEGAIIPQYQEMDYVGQHPFNDVVLDIYPGADSSFMMYEDDGISFDYKEGKVASTAIRLEEADSMTTLTVAARSGAYEGMPELRRYGIVFHVDAKPAEVICNGQPVAEGETGFIYDEQKHEVILFTQEDASREKPLVVSLVK